MILSRRNWFDLGGLAEFEVCLAVQVRRLQKARPAGVFVCEWGESTFTTAVGGAFDVLVHSERERGDCSTKRCCGRGGGVQSARGGGGARWPGSPSPGSTSCQERLVLHCRTTTAPRTPRRTCCPYACVLITVLRVSRSCEIFPNGFDLHLLHPLSLAVSRKHVLRGQEIRQKSPMASNTPKVSNDRSRYPRICGEDVTRTGAPRP